MFSSTLQSLEEKAVHLETHKRPPHRIQTVRNAIVAVCQYIHLIERSDDELAEIYREKIKMIAETQF